MILLGTVEPAPWDLARLRAALRNGPGRRTTTCVGCGFWHPLSIFAALRPRRRGPRPNARGRPRPPHRRPAGHRVSLAARQLRRHDARSTTPASRRCRRRRFPAIAGFDEARDLDARARYLLGLRPAPRSDASDPAIRLMEESVAARSRTRSSSSGSATSTRRRAGRESDRAPTSGRSPSTRRSPRPRCSSPSSCARGATTRAPESVLRAALARSRDDAGGALAAARLLARAGRAAEAPAVARRRRSTKEPAERPALHLARRGQALAAAGRPQDATRRAATGGRRARRGGRRACSARPARRSPRSATSTAARRGATARASRARSGERRRPSSASRRSTFRRGDAAAGRAAREPRPGRCDPYNADGRSRSDGD